MKVKKFVYAPVEDFGYRNGTMQLDIRVEIDGLEYGHRSVVSDMVPYHVAKSQAFRALGAEIARKLEAQV